MKNEQEPVAWLYINPSNEFKTVHVDDCDYSQFPTDDEWFPVYTAPQKYCPSENNAAYEKGFVDGMAKQMHSSVDRAVNAMAKPWVGLTDVEIKGILDCGRGGLVDIKKVEQLLKERNGES